MIAALAATAMLRLSKVLALWRLGPANLLRVGAYRALVKSGFYRWWMPVQAPLTGPFLAWQVAGAMPHHPPTADPAAWAALAERVQAGQLRAFSHCWVDTGFPPRWHRSVLSQVDIGQPGTHWTRLPDFSLAGGDIKGYWEPGRFDGFLVLVLGWLCTRRDDLRHAIDHWLADFCLHNPANAGPQWKCGQETGIRLMQVLLGVDLLQRWAGVVPAPAMAILVQQHCARIAPTMLYAVGQENNHGTSEAAALYIAGLFLGRHAPAPLARQGMRWQRAGLYWLNNRLQHLVLPDGSFSQHSVNYHRVMLDTVALAATWQRAYGAAPWPAASLERCRSATHWLADLTDSTHGDAPNLGANDGARLFVLHRQPYRDFRPSVQWASSLFLDRLVFAPGPHNEPLDWLQLPHPATGAALDDLRAAVQPTGRLWPDGGYAKLAAPRAWSMLRLPQYRFRPSHADGLHLDLWLDGQNLLCDAGTFGYNADTHWMRYFSGTESHNTVQFDGRDQMPKLSRFLFGDWLRCSELRFDAAASTVTAAYLDSRGARHRRQVTLKTGRCTVVDEISGFQDLAVLRWRLSPSGGVVTCGDGWCDNGTLRISVESSGPLARFECVDGWQSRHYADKSTLVVLEVEVRAASTLTTTLTWAA